jgi:hypothetical protein
MKKSIYLLIVLIFLNGSAVMANPETMPSDDIDKITNSHNEIFFRIYDSDLQIWIGKSLQELDEVFNKVSGSRSLDTYGNGSVVFKPIYFSDYDSSKRLIFYLRNNKIYNVVKED